LRSVIAKGISLALDEFHAGNPVPRASRKANILTLFLEGCGRTLEEGRWYTFEDVDVDDGVEVTLDTARDNRDNAAPGADVKLSGPSPEGVLGNEQWVSDGDLETASRARRPNASMLGAERAIARAGRYLLGFGLPGQGKRDIFAVTAAGDQHELLLDHNRPQGSDISAHHKVNGVLCAQPAPQRDVDL